MCGILCCAEERYRKRVCFDTQLKILPCSTCLIFGNVEVDGDVEAEMRSRSGRWDDQQKSSRQIYLFLRNRLADVQVRRRRDIQVFNWVVEVWQIELNDACVCCCCVAVVSGTGKRGDLGVEREVKYFSKESARKLAWREREFFRINAVTLRPSGKSRPASCEETFWGVNGNK